VNFRIADTFTDSLVNAGANNYLYPLEMCLDATQHTRLCSDA